MSRAFVKEPDGDQVIETIPERRQSAHVNYVTPGGLRALEQQVRELAEARRALAASGSTADPKPLRLVDRDLRYYAERISRAVVVDPQTQPVDEVGFGSCVTVETPEGRRLTFTIVGEDEADAATGKISWCSPLARSLTEARIGEEVVWKRPAGDSELRIVAIAHIAGE